MHGFLWVLIALSAMAKLPFDPADIRVLAPPRAEMPVSIARPESGNNVSSIGADWALRQFQLMSGGADQRFLDDANRQLERWFLAPNSSAPVTVESAGGPRSPASFNSSPWYRPSSVHVPQFGQIEFGFAHSVRLGCDVKGECNLSQALKNDIDLRLHHEDDANTIELQIPW